MAEVLEQLLETAFRLVLEFVYEVVCHGLGRSIRWLVGAAEPVHAQTDGLIGLIALIVLVIAACGLTFGTGSACQLNCR
jgi:hypothetical protein